MSNHKYVGMDVHLATVVVAVLDTRGKCVCQSVIETQGGTILEFIERALAGPSTWSLKRGRESAWLYDLLGPRVAEVVVCNTRKHEKVSGENHADRLDARKLANRLRLGDVKAVYKGERGLVEAGRTRVVESMLESVGSASRCMFVAPAGLCHLPAQTLQRFRRIVEGSERETPRNTYNSLHLSAPSGHLSDPEIRRRAG